MRVVAGPQGLALQMFEAPIPQPGAGEVLIRIAAAGVIQTELNWYSTAKTRAGGPRAGAIPGHEFSGIVEQCGEGVTELKIGQPVYGMNDWFGQGATAEFCLATPASIAPKPDCLNHAEAASVPISALTAWQGLFVHAHLQPGERVLIHGGAGGVGTFAIQLARHLGAFVIATASARNLQFVTQLGADRAIDYNTAPFEEAADPVDVVFDTVGGETLERSRALTSQGARLVTIASGAENSTDARVKEAFFIVTPSAEQLGKVSNLLQARTLIPIVNAVVPFENADAAYRGEITASLGRGKTVIALTE